MNKQRCFGIILSLIALNSPTFAAISSDDLDIIEEISLNSNSFDLRSQKDRLEINVKTTTEIRSIQAVLIRKDLLSKKRKIFSKRGSLQDDGSFKINLALKKNTQSGIWDLRLLVRTFDKRKLVFLEDDLEKFSLNPKITIISNKDNLAPQILDIEFTDTVNLQEENPSVLVNVKTFDVSNSSVVKAQFSQTNAKKNQNKKTAVLSSETSISSNIAEHLFNIGFTKASELGDWFLKILVKDSKGNKKKYSGKKLEKLSLKNKLSVVSQPFDNVGGDTTDDETEDDEIGDHDQSSGNTNPDTGNSGGDDSDLSQEETLVVAPDFADDSTGSPLEDPSFIFTGDDPLQTGVNPADIDPQRQAIIRGRLFDTEAKPLEGVEVTILNHPEFGQTNTLVNGEYTLVVNGGRSYIINFKIDGCLPVQRNIRVPKRDFYVVEEVRLTHLSSESHIVSFGGDVAQVVVSEMEKDADGERNATVIFPVGVHAQMEMDDGKMMDLDTGHFRITEYTVGEEGEMAMPGDLPGISGYTYAVELSFDEAFENDSETVVFDKPVPLYVMNFLEFPVGETVPVGYYDRKKAAWVASDNGIVIKILQIVNGKATVSVTSDQSPATDDQLLKYDFTDEELVKLAETHEEGETLWRALLTHFSPWDLNWPFGPPSDATEPPSEPPENEDQNNPEDPEKECGSIIQCEPQILGESVPITGTNMTLEYRSDRVPGRTTSRRIRIPVTNNEPPESLERIVVTVKVAGQKHKKVYQASDIDPNLVHFFEWNGKDVYGRDIFGKVDANVNVSYQYQGFFFSARPDLRQSFALTAINPSSTEANIIGNRDTAEIKVERNYIENLWNINAKEIFNLSGWSISGHHDLNPEENFISFGYGDIKFYQDRVFRKAHNTVYGGSQFRDIVQSKSDSNIYYIADHQARVILKYKLNENLFEVYAGGGVSFEDGAQALDSNISLVESLEIDDQENLYFTTLGHPSNNYENGRKIRKIDVNGIVTTVVGTGEFGSDGDGGLAVNAKINSVQDLDFGPDGSLYFLTGTKVRKVDKVGVISTVWRGDILDEGLYLHFVVSANNELYISTFGNFIVKINTDGSKQRVIGNGFRAFSGDGGQAIDATINNPGAIDVDQQGNIYFADRGNKRIRKISSSGIVTTVIGTGDSPVFSGISDLISNPLKADIGYVSSMLIDDENNIVAVYSSTRIAKIQNSAFELLERHYKVSSEDASQYYEFDEKGKHLATYDALTNDLIYEFKYENGLLKQILDSDGKNTIIERSGDDITAIISPDGLRTEIEIQNGYITKITNPENQSYSMTYTNKGLMKSFTNRRANTSTFEYGRHGRLLKDKADFGNSWTLDRDIKSRGFTVEMKSELGRKTTHEIKVNQNGNYVRKITRPNGSIDKETIFLDESMLTETADGTSYKVEYSSDPRFGVSAKFPSQTLITSPSGINQVIRQSKSFRKEDDGSIFDLESYTIDFYFNDKRTRQFYDAEDREIRTTSPVGRRSKLVLDPKEPRIIERQRGNFEPTKYEYNDENRLKAIIQGEGSSQRLTSFEYDINGYLYKITNAEGQVTSFDRNKLGLIKAELSTGGLRYEFEFDENDNPINIKLPKVLDHQFNYNSADLVSEYNAPQIPNYLPRNFEYSLDKEIKKISREDASVIDYSYNNKGQLKKITTIDGEYGLDYFTNTGKLKSSSTPDSNKLKFEYDGFLLTREDMDGDIDHDISFSYNNDFLLAETKVDGTNAITYQYDDDNLLTNAGDLTLRYFLSSNTLNSTEIASFADDYDYNDFAELSQYVAKYNSSTIFKENFTRDKLGRITQKLEELNGVTKKFDYSYDAENRLATVLVNDISVSSYEYDDNGNRVKVNSQSVAFYDDQDRLLSYGNKTYSYNPNGELVQKQNGFNITDYSYDAFGNLKSAKLGDKNIEYVIDARGRRIAKKVDGVINQGFVYKDQLNPIAETDGQGNVVSRFVYASKINIPDYMMRDSKKYKIVSDSRGSVRLVIDLDDGSTIQRIDYDEFGNVVLDTNPGFQPFAFAGGLYDQDTKLTLFGARNYDAEVGRWISKDPILFNGKQGNLYVYVNNDPINFIDPNGLQFSSTGTILRGAGVGFVQGAVGGAITGSFGGGIGAVPGAILGGLGGSVAGTLNSSKVFGDSVAGQSLSGAIGGVIGGPGGIVEGALAPILEDSMYRAGDAINETNDLVFGDQPLVCK